MQYGHVYKCIGTKYTKATRLFKGENLLFFLSRKLQNKNLLKLCLDF